MKRFIDYKKGEVFVFTEGHYADLTVVSVIRVLKDFDSVAWLTNWALKNGKEVVLSKDSYGLIDTKVVNCHMPDIVSALVGDGLVEELDWGEVNVGAWGDVSL